MELPRLLALTCVLGVCAALCYARGAPAREAPAPSPVLVTAAFPPPPPLPTTTVTIDTKPVLTVPKAQKRRAHRR